MLLNPFSDEELKAWAKDIHDNAFPPSGHPLNIVTRDESIKLCTVIIFTGSVQHASINFGQYAIYGYITLHPAHASSNEEGAADYQRLVDTLPTENDAKLSINISFALSEHSRDEVGIEIGILKSRGLIFQGWIQDMKKEGDQLMPNWYTSINWPLKT